MGLPEPVPAHGAGPPQGGQPATHGALWRAAHADPRVVAERRAGVVPAAGWRQVRSVGAIRQEPST